MELTKIEAAVRQLDTAIQLFFEKRDPVSIRTLIAAAGRILSDLVEYKKPGESWRSNTVKSIPTLTAGEVYDILNSTPNFLKHADRDPESVHLFTEAENEDLIFMATLECGEIHSTSLEMQAFQIWYMAAHPERFPTDNQPAQDAKAILPALAGLDHEAQIDLGAQFLSEQRRDATAAV
jgi:hypothetical protein